MIVPIVPGDSFLNDNNKSNIRKITPVQGQYGSINFSTKLEKYPTTQLNPNLELKTFYFRKRKGRNSRNSGLFRSTLKIACYKMSTVPKLK